MLDQQGDCVFVRLGYGLRLVDDVCPLYVILHVVVAFIVKKIACSLFKLKAHSSEFTRWLDVKI